MLSVRPLQGRITLLGFSWGYIRFARSPQAITFVAFSDMGI